MDARGRRGGRRGIRTHGSPKTSTAFEAVPFVRSGSLPGARLAANGHPAYEEATLGSDPSVSTAGDAGVGSDELDQVLVDDVVDAVVVAVAGVLVGLHDHQAAVLERVGHRPGSLERRGRVA